MKTIQLVLDSKLLRAADRAAHRMNVDRSALICDALREHLKSLNIGVLEERDRGSYASMPQGRDESVDWESEAAWPVE